jgi:molecular chaperone GrpE
MNNDQVKEELENKDVQTDTPSPAENEAAVNVDAGSAEKGQDSQVSELNKLKDEIAGAKDKYLRLYSEFENFRRRTAKEKLELIQSANEQLLQALLPVLDDFERAEKSFKEKNDKDSEGFFLIQSKFKKVLETYSVKIMDVQRGSDFNPDVQEAITQIPAPEASLKGKVVDVVEKGYLLNDKVIRFAKVVVGS